MALTASRQTREETPVGTYAARCVDVFDAGWWKNLNDEWVNKIKVVFYLGKDDQTGRDLYIDAFETRSLGKKANLTKLLVAWLGRSLTNEELKEFDLETLVYLPALIQVGHKEKKDGGFRAIIGSIMKLPKGMPAPGGAPEQYTPDKDRDEPMATKYPRPAGSAPKQPVDLENVKQALDLAEEDDDLPF